MARVAALVILLLVAPALAGCLSFLEESDDAEDIVRPADVGHDPTSIKVSSVREETMMIESFDGTQLAAVAYVPQARVALPDGSPPTWPVVVLLHGWGFAKEQWQNFPLHTAEGEQPTDMMELFAREGFITIAYDSRGFGRSGGTTTVAGPAEMADLDAVIAYAEENYPASGFVGAAGTSYGAGQSLLGLVKNPRITTAAIQYGWTDLYDALIPGNVPKLEWAEMLWALGTASSGVTGSGTMIHDWYTRLYTRQGFDDMEAAMDIRSAGDRLAHSDKPFLVCQGMQETLFPQVDRAATEAAGFTRAYVFTGGHSALNAPCWERTLDWFRFWLRGIDTAVDAWPALETVGASDSSKWASYDEWPETRSVGLYLRAPDLSEVAYSNATFTIQQRPVTNPFNEPGVVWESLGRPSNAIPSQFRQDPGGVFFYGEPATESETLVGAPVLELALANGTPVPAQFQVIGTLFKESEGRQQILTRAAYAALDADDVNTTVTLRFDWTKVDIAPGESLVLKLASNDPSMYMPLFANYSVTFTGASNLMLHYYTG